MTVLRSGFRESGQGPVEVEGHVKDPYTRNAAMPLSWEFTVGAPECQKPPSESVASVLSMFNNPPCSTAEQRDVKV